MATGTVVPVSEYLHTLYRPDCDYVDGEIQERNLGELDHSDLQSRFLRLLWAPENVQHVYASPELRVKVSSTRFRVPDVCVRSTTAPREQIIRIPPLLCIEVLSPEDTLLRTLVRSQDFLDMGVPEVWIVDPVLRAVFLCRATGMTQQNSGEVTVPGTPVTLSLQDIFRVLG